MNVASCAAWPRPQVGNRLIATAAQRAAKRPQATALRAILASSDPSLVRTADRGKRWSSPRGCGKSDVRVTRASTALITGIFGQDSWHLARRLLEFGVLGRPVVEGPRGYPGATSYGATLDRQTQ
jgi:hypothetical protein